MHMVSDIAKHKQAAAAYITRQIMLADVNFAVSRARQTIQLHGCQQAKPDAHALHAQCAQDSMVDMRLNSQYAAWTKVCHTNTDQLPIRHTKE
jgi:invasion protein IalB